MSVWIKLGLGTTMDSKWIGLMPNNSFKPTPLDGSGLIHALDLPTYNVEIAAQRPN